MRSGQCRHKIDIEVSVDTPNSVTGQLEEAWSVHAPAWASITPVQGNERFAWAQERADISHLIECRYIEGVVPKMRIKYGTRVFDITSVTDEQERGRWLRILAVEQV